MENLDFSKFYTSLIVIVAIIVLGFFLGKKKWVDEHVNSKLVNLLLSVFMPASLLSAFPSEYSEEYSGLFFQGLICGLITMVLVIVLAKLIYNKKAFPGKLSYEGQFAFIFNNATFLGYPLISMAFGDRGIVPYCGFIIMFNFALFSYGVWLFERKINAKFIIKTITNPNIIAVLIGMLFFVFRVDMETVIPVTHSAVKYIAGATTPLSLICVGYMLSTAKLKSIFSRWKLFIIAIVQLVLAPLITFLVSRLCGFSDEVVLVCTLIQALPTATSLGLFAEKYGGDVAESSELVVISTVMSVVTMPLIMALLFTVLPQYL